MKKFLTPEEVAEILKVPLSDVLASVDDGTLTFVRIRDHIRISEEALERLESNAMTYGSEPVLGHGEVSSTKERWCLTRSGRAKFRVSGSIAEGAEIWPGQMRYPIKFPKNFMIAMLDHFDGEVPIGGQFDAPSRGSLGEFIQRKLHTKMNPAVYIAALLIEEGYAEPGHRRGDIRFRHKKP